MTSRNWKDFLEEQGASAGVLPYWLSGLYRDGDQWEKNVSPELVSIVREKFVFALPEITRTQKANDGTTKFQMKMTDGLEVETVLLPFHKRFTVCLSTQVGCGMNCSFCFTGTMGLKRNLTAGEIVGQYLVAKNYLRSTQNNPMNPSIVFMGQGEPLHNVVEVKAAITILNDPAMTDVGLRQMTLSTVGYLPAMDALKEFPKINIALSLHSPFEVERNLLIPINAKYPLREIMASLDELSQQTKKLITFEYLLIKNLNMTDEHVEELSKLLGSRKAILNLIPMNPWPGSRWERPTTEETEIFRQKLVAKKLRVMLRTTKGDDILAACGQLKVEGSARRKHVH